MKSRLILKWKNSAIRRALSILTLRNQRKIFAVIFIQISMGILDLLGVALIGILGALTVKGIQSIKPEGKIAQILSTLNIENSSFQVQAAVLGGSATIILVARTLFSIIFFRRILFFLSRQGSRVSAELTAKVLSQSLLDLNKKSSQEIVYSITSGVNIITLGILGTLVSLISDVSLLVVLGAGLFIVDPWISILSILFFASIGLFMFWATQLRAKKLGEENAFLSVLTNEKILEVLSSYREAVVKNRRNFYARQIGELRFQLADNLAETAFLPNISKYVIETSIIIGALAISAAQFVLQDAIHAISTLSIFLAAGTRIAPAVLRVQQAALTIRLSLGAAVPTLNMIESLENVRVLDSSSDKVESSFEGFIPEVIIKNLTFCYPGNNSPAISNLNLNIPAGVSVAIVGSSGAGKTTLVDLLLGIILPDNGEIKISGISPSEAIKKWPGAISYVPQDVMISNGTIRENISLGYPSTLEDLNLIEDALRVSSLLGFIDELENGLDSNVGERGTRLSGGQKQRLGIARALFTKPKLLIFDEATSSLDGQTEFDISESIKNLKGSVTVIMIAHRLSTVRNADQVIYLNDGKITAVGTFAEVRVLVKDFDNQARLMGL